MGYRLRQLTETLAEIWDRTQHIFAKVEPSRLLMWLFQLEAVNVEEDEAGSPSAIYPADWGVSDPYILAEDNQIVLTEGSEHVLVESGGDYDIKWNESYWG